MGGDCKGWRLLVYIASAQGGLAVDTTMQPSGVTCHRVDKRVICIAALTHEINN